MKSNKTVKLIGAIVVVIVVFFIVFFMFNHKKIKKNESTGFAMGSVVTVTVYGSDDDTVAREIFEAINNEENEYISRYKESSEIYNLNKSSQATVSEHTTDLINRAFEISEKTEKAFDITIGAVSELWNFDNDVQLVPDDDSINRLKSDCGYEKVVMTDNSVKLFGSQQLDLGAVGKGYGCDKALEILKKHSEITGAVVSVGGTILTYGENPYGDCWTVGIRTPDVNDTSVFISLKVKGEKFISTSGNYEKCFEKDGVFYHHILSPETGYPVDNNLKGVTVIAEDGFTADALSTACYVAGIENSIDFVNYYNAKAVFIDNENVVYASESIIDNISFTNGDGTIESYEKYSVGQK